MNIEKYKKQIQKLYYSKTIMSQIFFTCFFVISILISINSNRFPKNTQFIGTICFGLFSLLGFYGAFLSLPIGFHHCWNSIIKYLGNEYYFHISENFIEVKNLNKKFYYHYFWGFKVHKDLYLLYLDRYLAIPIFKEMINTEREWLLFKECIQTQIIKRLRKAPNDLNDGIKYLK